MHGMCWWGQVLKVDALYRSSNQAAIRSLFSGVQSNGRDVGRGGTDVRSGHEQGAFPSVSVALHPPLTERDVLVDGFEVPFPPSDLTRSCFSVSNVSLFALTFDVAPPPGKSADSMPRSSIVSYERYIECTELLT